MGEHTLLLHRLAVRLRQYFNENRLPFLSSCLIGLLCYGYAFANKLVNHDEVQSLFLKGATVTSGRWGLGFLDTVFPNYSMPWIYGIISLVLIACTACVLVRILGIRSSVLQVLLAGSVMAFPSLMGTFAYMFTASSFALSFLLAVVSAAFLRRSRKILIPVAIGCMVGSLSIYQSYISVAAGLLVVCLVKDLLAGEDLPVLIRRGVGYVLFLAASLGLYYGATQMVFLLKDVTFNDYASGNMGFSLAGLPAAAVEAYRSFLRFFTEGYRGLIVGRLSRILHPAIMGTALVLCGLGCLRQRSAGRGLLLAFLLAVLPLAVNCMYLFTAADAVHTLVLYGFVNLYALAAVAADAFLVPGEEGGPVGPVCVNLVSLALALVLVSNTYLANQIWLNLQLRYENTYAFYTGLMADLRRMPEFGPDSKLALIGSYQDPEYYGEQFEMLDAITGVRGISPDTYSNQRFLEYYVGIELPFATAKETAALAAEPAVQQMPVYPYYGSIAVFGDTLVVKLS